MTDEEIKIRAIEFSKKNKNRIAKELTDVFKYKPDIVPISVFMAGSPGAGKTEFSKNLISILEKNMEHQVVRIDGDEIRPLIPGYAGNNSHLFQGAISLIVEKIHDYVLHQKQSFIFDSTFSKHDKAVENIHRSLDHNRPIFIFYIYQKPDVAWKFTQAREVTEGRNIPKPGFIEQFFGARKTVDIVINEFKDKVTTFLVKKDFEKNTVEDIIEIGPDGANIDDHIKERYTEDNIDKLL